MLLFGVVLCFIFQSCAIFLDVINGVTQNLVLGKAFLSMCIYGSSYGQAGIILTVKRHIILLVKRHITSMIIKDITTIKMGSDQSFIVISAALGNRFCNLRRRLIILLIFPDTIFRWSSNFN